MLILLGVSIVVLIAVLIAAVALYKKDSVPKQEENNTAQIETEVSTEQVEDLGVTDEFTMFFTGDVMLQNVMAKYDAQGIHGILSPYLVAIFCNSDL